MTARLLKVREAAEALSTSQASIRRYVDLGLLQPAPLPSTTTRGEPAKGGLRFATTEIDRFITEECQP